MDLYKFVCDFSLLSCFTMNRNMKEEELLMLHFANNS